MRLNYLHESACLDVQHVYYELRVLYMAAGLNCTHKSVLAKFMPTLHFPFLTREVCEVFLTTCDCVHGLYYRLSDALIIDCELHPTECSLI